MATENIVKGKKFRILKDAVNNIWDRISFWTAASDVYLDSGSNLEDKIGNITMTTTAQTITGAITELKTSTEKSDFSTTPIRKTLNAGATSISFTDAHINSNSVIDIYTSIFGVSPTNGTVSGNTCTLTFDAQSSAMTVAIMVYR